MTEEELKQTWCPHVRTGRLTMGMAVNRHVADDPEGGGVYDATRCRGSGCSQWRWVQSQTYMTPKGDKPPPVVGEGAWVIYMSSDHYDYYRLEPRHGYCGLAGKPEDL